MPIEHAVYELFDWIAPARSWERTRMGESEEATVAASSYCDDYFFFLAAFFAGFFAAAFFVAMSTSPPFAFKNGDTACVV